MDSPTEHIPPSPEYNDQSWGAVVGIIIIVTLLIAGGLYFFMSGQAQRGIPAPAIGAGRA